MARSEVIAAQVSFALRECKLVWNISKSPNLNFRHLNGCDVTIVIT